MIPDMSASQRQLFFPVSIEYRDEYRQLFVAENITE
jgi:hypothetical protein